jgi:phosphoribosylformylglycinamidine synthase PurS subunit
VRALVHVTLKQGVLDPQGKAIQRASTSLGLTEVESVRQGKLFEVELAAPDAERARVLLDELCVKLLANPVIEDYEIVELG